MNDWDVFINCPFSADYENQFHAIIFTVIRSGFEPRCARENDDGGEVRIDKICRIIRQSRFGIHDISKTELDSATQLPRFNMPLELGLFLGARVFGGRGQAKKKTLILDREAYRYQKFISDIAGQDIHAHGADVSRLIETVATWLRHEGRDEKVPGGRAIAEEYARFRDDLPRVAAAKRLATDELAFNDITAISATWIMAESGSHQSTQTNR